MDIYNNLLEAVHNEYDTIRLIKKSERGEVSLVRHRDSGTRYIFRHFYGSSEVYQLLLTISCPYLQKRISSRQSVNWKNMYRGIHSEIFWSVVC